MEQKRQLVMMAGCLAGSTVLLRAGEPPVAEVRDVVDTHYGVEVHDPYRWFEKRADPELKKWTKGQAEYAAEWLGKLPLREKFLKRQHELEQETGPEKDDLFATPDGYVYLKRQPGESVGRLFRRDREGKETLLVDPARLAEGDQPPSIDYFTISPDGKMVSVGISTGGSENAALSVFEIASGKRIAGPVERVRWGGASWLPDNSGFFYNQLQDIGPDGDRQQTFQNSTVLLHRFGVEKDVAVLRSGLNQEVSIKPQDLPGIQTFPGTPWAVAMISTGVSPNQGIHVARADEVQDASAEWTPVASMQDDVGGSNGIAINGDSLFLLTRRGAPNGKIIGVDLKEPKLAEAKHVYSAGKGVIRDLMWAKDGMYVKVLEGGPSHLVRLPFGNTDKPERVPLPQTGKIWPMGADPRIDGLSFYFGSWINPDRLYRYDPKTNRTTDTGVIDSKIPEICSELVQDEVMVPSHDGVKVPLSIIHRKGLKRDGSNPVLLVGYGAYGISLEPYFRDRYVPLLEHGAILAIAHVRGGGEFGEKWRLAGYQKTKPNTWKDFIACAEFLVRGRYTEPRRLCGEGRSAGGILIGRAITERPDLFGSAVIGVGVCDAVRAENTPNGVPNIPEFGTVKNEEQFHALLEMSAYHHVKDGVKYPAVLIMHGANDTRVELWQSLKMAARLQAATASGEPVLMRVDFESGHGSGSGAEQRMRAWADQLAFLFDRAGGG
jgi:prolyl oligopeptidase